jgi:DNA segregation ATPase FtsK/SpoIIIE, S-DNA-T family
VFASVLHSDKSHREFLPEQLGSGLRGWLRRFAGATLLGLMGLGWLGLLSWELPGPGSAAANSGFLVQLIGSVPSQIADMLLQSFGFGATVLFSIPTYWAFEHLSRRALPRPFRRLTLWPAASLAAACALSALPAPSSWPFSRGLGGVVGDQGLGVARTLLSFAGSNVAGLVAGLGFAVLAAALFAMAVRTEAPVAERADAVDAPELGNARKTAMATEWDFGRDAPADDSAPTWDGELGFAPDIATQRPHERPQPSVRMETARKEHAPAFVPMAEPASEAPAAVAHHEADAGDAMPMHVPYDDMPEEDDEQSRIMAKRFAPKPQSAAASEPDLKELSGEPPAWPGWRAFLERAGEAVATAKTTIAQAAPQPVEPPAPVVPAATPVAQPAFPPRHFKTETAVADDLATGTVRTWKEAATTYRLPPASLLAPTEAKNLRPESDNAELVAAARRLEDVLADFGVRGKIISVLPGPAVTHYELEAATGVKLTRVIGLAEDIARTLGVTTARIAPIPGRSSIGIELPNERHEIVSLRGLMETRSYRHNLHALPLAVGMGVDRQPIISDLSQLPGLLVTGEPGSGKSTALSAMLLSLLLRLTPEELRLLVIDPKGVDHRAFDGISHLLSPVLSDAAQASSALSWCVAEMEERLKVMAKLNMRGIGTYNNAVRNALRQGTGFKRSVQTGFDRKTGRAIYEEESFAPKAMPYIAVVVDDLELLLQNAGEAADQSLQRLGQMARAAGIHIIAATGRLDSDKLSAGLRSNLPARLTFKLPSKSQSRLAINDGGAELLLGAGDLLFGVGGAPVRGQAPMLGQRDVAKVVEAIRRQGPPNYEAAIGQAMTPQAKPTVDTETYQQAVSLTIQQGGMSVTDLRARLGLAYGVANDLMGRMQESGLVSADVDDKGRRPVLLGRTASA